MDTRCKIIAAEHNKAQLAATKLPIFIESLNSVSTPQPNRIYTSADSGLSSFVQALDFITTASIPRASKPVSSNTDHLYRHKPPQ